MSASSCSHGDRSVISSLCRLQTNDLPLVDITCLPLPSVTYCSTKNLKSSVLFSSTLRKSWPITWHSSRAFYTSSDTLSTFTVGGTLQAIRFVNISNNVNSYFAKLIFKVFTEDITGIILECLACSCIQHIDNCSSI